MVTFAKYSEITFFITQKNVLPQSGHNINKYFPSRVSDLLYLWKNLSPHVTCK